MRRCYALNEEVPIERQHDVGFEAVHYVLDEEVPVQGRHDVGFQVVHERTLPCLVDGERLLWLAVPVELSHDALVFGRQQRARSVAVVLRGQTNQINNVIKRIMDSLTQITLICVTLHKARLCFSVGRTNKKHFYARTGFPVWICVSRYVRVYVQLARKGHRSALCAKYFKSNLELAQQES